MLDEQPLDLLAPTDIEALEDLKAAEKFDRQHARTIRDFGYGATVGGLAITRKYTAELSTAISAKVEATLSNKQRKHGAVTAARFVKLLDPDVVAALTLGTAINSVANGSVIQQTVISLGRCVDNEIWALGLQEFDAKLAERIDQKVRKTHGSFKYRRQAARSIARHAGFSQNKPWTNEEAHSVGGWLLDALLATLGDVFEVVLVGEYNHLAISEGAEAFAVAACDEAVRRNPVFMPLVEPPDPWVSFVQGSHKGRSRSVLVRTHHRETRNAVTEAIKNETMKPCLDALNAIQGTAWRINEPVMAVMQQCFDRGIEIDGFPRAHEYPKPPKPKAWDQMTDAERRLWKLKASEIKEANRARIGHNLSFAGDMATAEIFKGRDFYTPCNMDWRGRVYALPHFNFQREDRVRALFLFSEAKPIGEDGIKWLKVHLANCGDFDKVSKRSFEERVEWVDRNITSVLDYAEAPMSHIEWTKADKPFLFLAAAMELSSVLRWGPSFASALPLSWDGSCSGLQHLCAMTRAEEGRLVNLTDTPEPQDVYSKVADETFAAIERDRTSEDEKTRHYASYCADYTGNRRKVVKRNVMTYFYSSKKFGMGQQHIDDLMKPLRLEVLQGKIEEHPFGENHKTQEGCARYLASKAHTAIESLVHRPAKAMAFLQRLARAMAHEGKPLEWTTPVGLPWSNRYHPTVVKQVRLWLHDKGITLHPMLAVGYEKDIAKDKAANGVAPNFVHALDAAHLMLTVNAGYREGMRAFALVHDSFGCHASDSERFHQIIREEFVSMYEQHDVLDEVYQRAKCALNEHNCKRLPEAVGFGALEIKGVMNARYAFA